MPEIVDFHRPGFPPEVVDPRRVPAHTPATRAAWSLLTDIDARLERTGADVKVV